MQITDEQIAKCAESHSPFVADAASSGECPKCGVARVFNAKDPANPRLLLCHSCGNKFEAVRQAPVLP